MNRLKMLLILILTGTASVSQAWRDLETGTFLTRDPIGFEDGPNQYCYVHANPITKFDPLGLSPTRDQAGTVDDIVQAMNTSPSKIGEKTGVDASAALKYLGSTERKGFNTIPSPKATPYFNQTKGRYIYTEKGGWIDMVHFLFYAGKARTELEKSAKNPVGEAVQDGFKQEKLDPKHSKYSYEDLPSDKFGAQFGAEHFDPKSDKSLSEQMADYLKGLGATNPEKAPNWNELPKEHSKNPPSAINKTTEPMYTTPSTEKPTEKEVDKQQEIKQQIEEKK